MGLGISIPIKEAKARYLTNASWIDEVRQHLMNERISLVLDVGASTGAISDQIGKAFDADVICLDKSCSGLTSINEFPDDRVIPICAEATQIPFHDGSVDLLFASKLIHYLKDQSSFAIEAARVLRPGGWIAIRSFYLELEEIHEFRFFPEHKMRAEKNVPGISNIQSLFENVGFTKPRFVRSLDLVAPSFQVYLESTENDIEIIRLIGPEAHRKGLETLRNFVTDANRDDPVVDQLEFSLCNPH